MTDAQLLAGVSADVVVSNPPYVPETPELQQEVYADPRHGFCARGRFPPNASVRS